MHPISRIAHWRTAAAAAVAVLVCGFFIVTPTGQALASSFLAQFRSTQLQAVPVTSASLDSIDRALAGFQHLGTIQGTNGTRTADLKRSSATSVADAAQQSGLQVKVPDASTLPAGVNPTPSKITALAAGEYRFTFDSAKAKAYFQSINRPDLNLPANMNGATLVVNTPAAVLLQYGATTLTTGPGNETGTKKPAPGGDTGTRTPAPVAAGSLSQALVVGESGQLTLGTEGGATLDQIRTFLLTLPSLPPEAQAILSNTNWASTLPIPVPIDKVKMSPATIQGDASALRLDDNSGLGSVAIWHTGSQIYGVAGTMTSDKLTDVANSLH